MSQNKITVTISGVLTDLNNGMSRKEIKDKYSLNNDQMKQLFANPKLKGRKAKKSVGELVIIDDTEVQYEQYEQYTKEESPTQEDLQEAEVVATI